MSLAEDLRTPALSADSTGEDILELLRIAAEAAQRKERAAKAHAQALQDAITTARYEAMDLEQRVAAAEKRATEAEEWIARIGREITSGWVGATMKAAK